MMKRITLNRNGQERPRDIEASDLTAGRFEVGEHVMLGITGDCCYHRKEKYEYEVVGVEPCDRFGGGRETVTFRRVKTDAGAAILGALVALVVGAMGVGTILLGLSIATGRALI